MGARTTKAGRALIATFVALSALASGCSSTGGASDSPEAQEVDPKLAADVASRYGYDIDSATQTPVLALVPEYQSPQDIYARLLLLKQCMSGLAEYQVTPPQPTTDADVFDPRSGDRRFNKQIAERWGYQIPPMDPTNEMAEAGDVTAETVAKEEECGTHTRERLGNPPAALLGNITTAGWDALKASDDVRARAAEWKTCMTPAGIIDLPDNPQDMPSPSVAPMADEAPTEGRVPTAREREIAVMDAQCRDQVGFTAAEMRARAEGELSAIGRDIEGFESVRLEYQEYAKGIDQVIQELG